MKKRSDKYGSEFGVTDLIAFLRRSIAPALMFAAVAAGFTFWKLSKNPSFSSSGLVMLETSQNNRVQAMADKMTGFGNYASFDSERMMETFLITITSRSFALDVAKNLLARKDADFVLSALGLSRPVNMEEMATSILSNLQYSRQASNVIRLTVSHRDPKVSEKLVNIFLDEVTKVTVQRDTLDILEAHEFLEDQIAEVEERMKGINRLLDGANGKAGVFASEAVNIFAQQASDIEKEILGYKVTLTEVNTAIKEVLDGGNPTGLGPIDKYGALSSLTRLEKEQKVLSLKIASSQKVLVSLKEDAKKLPDTKRYFENLFRRLDIEYQLVSDLKKELMSLSIQKISAQNKIKVLEHAYDGSARANMDMAMAILKRSVFAAIVALLLVFLIDVIRPVVYDNRSLAHVGIPYLGSIPNLSRERQRSLFNSISRVFDRPFKQRNLPKSVTKFIEFSPDSEQDILIKNLRMRISRYRGMDAQAPKVIAFTSGSSGEGKTFITASIGKSLVTSGKRVLLIDADIRSKSLSKIFALGDAKGLGEYLEEPLAIRQKPLVQKLQERLEVLPAGRCITNATEVISGRHFEEMVLALRDFYDYVLIDTPPALPYSEVIPVAQASDLVVLTTFVGKTTVNTVDHVVDKIRFGSTTPIGYVLNMNEREQLEGYYPYAVTPHSKRSVA